MNEITTTNEISIEQDKSKNTLFTIKSNNYYTNNNFIFLLNSLTNTKIIQNTTLINNKSLMFKAFSIQTLEQIKEKMSHTIMLKMIYYLSKQLSYLINYENKCFFTYDPKNVIIIDNKIFAYLSQDHLVDFNNKNSNLYIYSPISKDDHYLSPELSICTKLPVIINYKTIFYSLGLLLLESLLGNKVEETLDETLEEKMSKIKSLKETKLYYFLERALNPAPNERFLLYI
jgi:hypothetical protein